MKNNYNGFTLIELLVAITIFAIMSAIAYGGLNYMLDTSDYLDQRQQHHRSLMMAIMRMEDDLAQVRPRTIRNIDGSSIPAFIGQDPASNVFGAPTMEFVRGGMAILSEAPRTDLQRVGYRLDDESRLIRMTWPVLDRTASTTALEYTLLDNVEEFDVRFFSRDNKPNWVNNWPVSPTQPPGQLSPKASSDLPHGIEVTLKIKDSYTITRLFLVNG